MALESLAVPSRRAFPPARAVIIATVIGLAVGFGTALSLARVSESELFHPSGAIVETQTDITRIYTPEGDRGVIYTSDDIPLTTWTTEIWDGDFLTEVLAQAGCRLGEPCSSAVSIPARVTYAIPKRAPSIS